MQQRVIGLDRLVRTQLGALAAWLCLGLGCSTVQAQDQPHASMAQLASQFDKTAAAVVAEVNGSPITAGMIADHMRDLSPALAALPAATIFERSVDDLVQQRSLAVKARELGLDKDLMVMRRIGIETDHTLANALIRHILPEMVTETAIKARYDATIAGKPGPVEVQLRVIVTGDEDQANLALAALRRGTAFGDVARASSIDATKASGGEVGFAAREQLAPEIAAVAFCLMPGQMSQFPLPSGGKWFIVEVTGRRQQATPGLETVRAALTAQLSREAAVEIIRKTRAAVTVNAYGPSGKQQTVKADP